MAKKETYAAVASAAGGDDEEDAGGDEEDSASGDSNSSDSGELLECGEERDSLMKAPTTANSNSSSSSCRIWLLITIAFLSGIALGSWMSRIIERKTTTSGAAATSASTENCHNNKKEPSVSYGFLQTPRGQSLLATLNQELHDGGPKAVLQHISRLIDDDDQIASSCHPLTHVIGRNAFRTFGFAQAWGGMVGTDDAALLRICNAAYMHGVIEHFLVASERLPDDVTTIKTTVCNKLTNVPAGVWECHHGVGHGVVQNYRRVQDRLTLTKSLAACQNTTFASDCENGLWMDHFASTRVSGQLEPSSLRVCDLARSAPTCAMYSPTEFLLHYPREYQQAIRFCQDGFNNSNTKAKNCINGVGMQAGKENQHDYGPVEEACLTAPGTAQQMSCLREALHYYTMTTGQSKLPPELCATMHHFNATCLQYPY